MTLVIAITIGVLFAAGIDLMLEHDLIRNVIGLLVTSHAMNVLLMAAHLRGAPASSSAPGRAAGLAPDPVAQALTLTAIVITFALATLLLALVYRIFVAHDSVDHHDLFEREYERLRDAFGASPEVRTDEEES